MMQRLFVMFSQLLLLLVVPLTIGLTAQAAAVDVLPGCDKGGVVQKTDVCSSVDPSKPGDNPIIHALQITIQILSVIIGFTAVVMVIVGGMQIITANGDAAAVAKARGTIIYALVGLAVAGFAQALVFFVLNKL